MTKGKINLRDKLRSHKFEFDLLQKIPCTKEENKEYQKILKNGDTLPEGVYTYEDDNGETSQTDFYTVYESDLTEAEIREYLTYKQLSMVKTIKNCVLFFTVLTIVSMIAYFLIMLKAF